MNEFFRRFAHRVSDATGRPWAFILAITVIAIWALTGPIFQFSDTWQLVINTGTTIITFLMVFLIQNTQNRDSKALHLKLDEIIRSLENARNNMIEVEDLSDNDLAQVQDEFRLLSAEARDDPMKPDRSAGEIMNQAVKKTVGRRKPSA